MSSANKFLQKIWNLNYLISVRVEKKINKLNENKFDIFIKNYLNKIDNSINTFRFNVAISYFYEIYKYLKDSLNQEISNKTIKEGIIPANCLASS